MYEHQGEFTVNQTQPVHNAAKSLLSPKQDVKHGRQAHVVHLQALDCTTINHVLP